MVILLSKPVDGRCVISFNGWIGEFNTTSDIPVDFYLSFLDAARTGKIISTKIKTNKYSVIFIFDQEVSYIISTDSEGSSDVEIIEIKRFKLINEFINDIKRDIDEWSKWPYYDEDSYEADERRKYLLESMDELDDMNNLPF